MLSWLKADARNRAWRTILQGIAATVGFAALDAVVQVYQGAATDALHGKAMDWTHVAGTAKYAAVTAALMAVAAYLHRRKLDPSRIPSAVPPEQPPPTPLKPATTPRPQMW